MKPNNEAPKKRILFFVSSMLGGGAERIAALLCNHWVECGHEVKLVPTFSGRGSCTYPLDSRIKLEYLADRLRTRNKSIINQIRRILHMRRIICEFEPDVVLSFLPNVNVATLLSSAGLAVPVVVSERSYPPATPLGRLLETLRKRLYPRAKTVVIQTEQGQHWLNSHIPGTNSVVIANPVVLPLPASEPRIAPSSVVDNQRKVLLAVGRLEKEKGFDLLLSAFALLAGRFSDWDLVILGEGALRPQLQAQTESLALTGRVFLPGRAGNMSDWYRQSDLYVMSSRFEGFPNTLIEAMAHGLSGVSFNCNTGPGDIIRHEIDGLLVPPASGPEGLAQSLASLMVDAAKREDLGRGAKDVRVRFSLDRISREWSDVLGLGA